jgi:hypothetical protein
MSTDISIRYGEVVVNERAPVPYLVARFMYDHGILDEDEDNEKNVNRHDVQVPEDRSTQSTRIRTLVISQTRIGFRSTTVPEFHYKKDEQGNHVRDLENPEFKTNERGVAQDWLDRVFNHGIRL